ncbi:hypothetical protein [Blastococcus sp. TF02A-26]|uniref:hypothetical protein n=1 Tax=Blastococcus sp. TF02A-26 TaxID=2250577 RepID=UPI000DEAEB4B|nr:hypothetical protein [Blastococcus sp. TF02A-26]RBY79692.1 hypothetical protein DQ240_22395 [Blastococcus sp. TF02A-26]
MSPSPAPRPTGFSRRTLLAGVAGTAGLVLLTACTGDDGGNAQAAPTPEEADRLAEQVAVQEGVVAAYAAAAAADPALGDRVAVQAEQAAAQLDRLRAAAPGATSSAPAGTDGPPPGGDVRGWLRDRIGAAADGHEAACADQAAGRAALLGSVAAGLRGQVAVLA